jgi:hypothetical protein
MEVVDRESTPIVDWRTGQGRSTVPIGPDDPNSCLANSLTVSYDPVRFLPERRTSGTVRALFTQGHDLSGPPDTLTTEPSMSDRNGARGDEQEPGEVSSDTEAGLQAELRREAAEGGKLVGDMESNRNVGGSSSWDTLPEADGSDDVGESDLG